MKIKIRLELIFKFFFFREEFFYFFEGSSACVCVLCASSKTFVSEILKFWFLVFVSFFFLQQSNAADLSRDSNLDCNGKEFKCVNQTHFQLCSTNGDSSVGSTTIDGVIESCIAGQTCDDQSAAHCGVKVHRKHLLKGSFVKRPAHRIRLIKGKRASNWRPRIIAQNEEQQKKVAEYRDRLINYRRKQESLIDKALAKQSAAGQKKKQVQKKDKKPTDVKGNGTGSFFLSLFSVFLK